MNNIFKGHTHTEAGEISSKLGLGHPALVDGEGCGLLSPSILVGIHVPLGVLWQVTMNVVLLKGEILAGIFYMEVTVVAEAANANLILEVIRARMVKAGVQYRERSARLMDLEDIEMSSTRDRYPTEYRVNWDTVKMVVDKMEGTEFIVVELGTILVEA